MFSIPEGVYAISCVLLNSETVVNNEAIRFVEVYHDRWTLQPANQQFRVVRAYSNSAMLNRNGKAYVAEFEIDQQGNLKIDLKQEGVAQMLSIEARLLTTVQAGEFETKTLSGSVS